MIRFVRGHLVAADAEGVVVGMGGMGFGIRVSDSTRADLPGIGSDVVLHTHLVVREDALDRRADLRVRLRPRARVDAALHVPCHARPLPRWSRAGSTARGPASIAPAPCPRLPPGPPPAISRLRIGASPSGKAAVFGTAIPRFES